MARQKGVIKFEGRVGDLSFYKSDGQYLARTKGGVDGDRIKKDPAFARTRENGGYNGSFCANYFGGTTPVFSVQTVPILTNI